MNQARIPGAIGYDTGRGSAGSVLNGTPISSGRGPIGLSVLPRHAIANRIKGFGPLGHNTVGFPNRGPMGFSVFVGLSEWIQHQANKVAEQVDEVIEQSVEKITELYFETKVKNWRLFFDSPPDEGISQEMWEAALISLQGHIENPRLQRPHIMTLVNFDLRADQPRLWTVNLEEGSVLFNVMVSHGGGIGRRRNPLLVCRFVGNIPDSELSSIGAFATALTSRTSTAGSPGHTRSRIALEVHGLDPTNNNAFARHILFHGAHYVNRRRAGRSEGCFATEDAINQELIPVIRGGSFVYAYKEHP